MESNSIFRKGVGTAGALLLGLALWMPASSSAWSHLGGSLALDQRDLRVHNNFTDPQANDNTSPDPEFPGASGAALAIWKAAAEWSSRPYGTGLADPTQPDGLGSAGANFEFHWQGLASSPGGTNDNIVSEISGSSSGVFAFCELPISDGWRIRFYADIAVWHDGPQAPPSGSANKDIQGVATHELGHALGLDHSNDPQATMLGALLGNGVNNRSIAPDDIAGIQALYGAASPQKPVIAAYHILGSSSIFVRGSGFAAVGNEVWFTRDGASAEGSPAVSPLLASSGNGTELVVPLPAGITGGNLLVRIPGNGPECLSNALPFTVGFSSCPPIQNYGTPKTNSLGLQSTLSTSGRASLLANDLKLQASNLPPGSSCVLLSGTRAANLPFLGGSLLLGGPLRRSALTSSDFTGSVEFSIPVQAAMVETRRFFQLWYQDPADPFGAGLSDALQIYFCP